MGVTDCVKVANFLADCQDLANGKFIFAEYKIGKMIKDIGESKELYSIFKNCMQDFDFDREFSRARYSPNQFILPQDESKLMALVFCVLVDINNKKVNLDKFLQDYFVADGGSPAQFKRFGEEFIKPFMIVVKAKFEEEDLREPDYKKENLKEEVVQKMENQFEESEQFEDDGAENIDQEKLDNFFQEITSICDEMLLELNCDLKSKKEKKDDAIYLVETIIAACEAQSVKYVSALIIAFEYVSESLKTLKFLTKELKNILIKFYM